MKKIVILLLFCGGFGLHNIQAQDVAVKTNLLYDATTTLNLGVEIGLSRHTTLDLSGNYNPWEFENQKKLKHWLIQPEFRYWSCEKFRRHFFGVHAFGGEFNVGGLRLPFGIGNEGIRKRRYIGDLYGAGVSYGYHWMLGGRWGVEATLGIGYAHISYKEYALPKCSPRLGVENRNYWGITKIGLTLIYIIK